MNHEQFLKIRRNIIGLMKALEESGRKEVKIDEKMVHYDRKGNVVEVRITRMLDWHEE